MLFADINFETMLPLIGAIFSFSFGLFIWLRSPKKMINILFLAFTTVITYWLFGTFEMFLHRDSVSDAIFWDRFVYIGVVFVPTLMHHFSLEITRNPGQRRILKFNYLFSFLFLFVSRTPYFVDGLNIFPRIVHTRAMIGHHIFLVLFYIIANIMFYNLYHYYKEVKDKNEKSVVILTAVAFLNIIIIGGTAYLPAYGINIGYPFSYFSGILFVIILSVAITKREMMSARVTIAEMFTFIVGLMFSANILLGKDIGEVIFATLGLFVFLFFGFEMVKTMRLELARKVELQVMAKKLAETNAHLMQMDEAKTEFLSIASHELRTPVSVIKGYISLMKEGAYGKVTKQMEEKLSHMFQMNERLVHIINNLLNTSRIEKNRVEFIMDDVDIAELTENAVEELSFRAKEKEIIIKLNQISKNLPTVLVDSEKIHEVFVNLIDNAVKYSPEKTTIRVSVKYNQKDNVVVVRIKDEGNGMTEETKDRVFHRYYRAKDMKTRKEKGTGLGLYICKTFIEGMGGSIIVEQSSLGKGTTIAFTLPVSIV